MTLVTLICSVDYCVNEKKVSIPHFMCQSILWREFDQECAKIIYRVIEQKHFDEHFVGAKIRRNVLPKILRCLFVHWTLKTCVVISIDTIEEKKYFFYIFFLVAFEWNDASYWGLFVNFKVANWRTVYQMNYCWACNLFSSSLVKKFWVFNGMNSGFKNPPPP